MLSVFSIAAAVFAATLLSPVASQPAPLSFTDCSALTGGNSSSSSAHINITSVYAQLQVNHTSGANAQNLLKIVLFGQTGKTIVGVDNSVLGANIIADSCALIETESIMAISLSYCVYYYIRLDVHDI